MPTPEERITVLEYGLQQFKTETIKAYGETAVELIMVKGLTEDALKRLASLREQTNQHFNQIQEILQVRFDATSAHLELLQKHAEKTDKRLDTIEAMLAEILARLPEKP